MLDSWKVVTRLWRKIQFERVTADTAVFEEPCFLFACGCCGDGSGTGDVVIRNSQSTDGLAKLDLKTTNQCIDCHKDFDKPIYFNKGLYLDIGSNITSAYVQFLPETEAKEL